ncbi:MAG: PQQ-dependent sugar dehydrogenase [Chloroflexia bacterium]
MSIACGLAALLAARCFTLEAVQAQASPFELPQGFAISSFAEGVQDARFLTYSPQGDLYVGQLLSGNSAITILPDRNHDGQADKAIRVATDLNSPNNVSFRRGVSETVFAAGAFDRVKVYTDTAGDLSFADSAVVVSGLSNVTTGRHKTKTVLYGPDGRLYLSKGAAGDDGSSYEDIAGIWRYEPDGSGGHKLASNLRNAVGIAWDSVGGGFWAADNGSDDLGPNGPHDELDLIRDGGDYGWPVCIDDRVPKDQAAPADCSRTEAPVLLLAPHAGVLGMAFYTGASFPQHYWGGLFVAYHSVQYPEQRGIYYIPFKDGRPSGQPEFFMKAPTNRPVGVAVNPYDGSLMVGDDRDGHIYRVTYTGPPALAPTAALAPPAAPGKPQQVPAPPLPGVSRVFTETGQSLSGPFLDFWFWNGGAARFGPPVSGPLTETLSGGQDAVVQYTQRARLEYHPESRGTWDVVRLSGPDTPSYADRYGQPGSAATPTDTPAPPVPTSTPPPPTSAPTPPGTSAPPPTTAPPTPAPTPTTAAAAGSDQGEQTGLLLGALAAVALCGLAALLAYRVRRR